MYKFVSQILMIASCVMLMVRSLPVNLCMVVCILVGIILCMGVDINFIKNDLPADGVIAAYILAGIAAAPAFFMLPYAVMQFWKKKYKLSMLAVLVVFLDAAAGIVRKVKTSYGAFEIAAVILLSLIGLMLSYAAEMIALHEKQLHEMRDESAEHELLMSQINHQLIETQNARIYNATLKERNRIAREIHDNVGHMITRSILQLGAIGIINQDEQLKTPIAELKNTLDTAMSSMRKSVHDLHDESVDLKAALQQLEPQTDVFQYILEYDCETELPRNIKYAFISIATEAVNNSVKYSNGDQIRVIVREHPAFYQLQIIDNGTQIDVKKMQENVQEGIGIKNIRERTAAMGGTLKIETTNGFIIFVTVMKNR